MPAIFVETILLTATVNNNIYSGSAFEFSRGRNVVSIGIVQSLTGMFATLQAGSDIIVEEFSLPIKTTYPIIPDEMYFTDVMENGDRLVGRVRNPTGGSITVRSVVQMQQV
jgi:hypothetical protein